MSGQMSWRDIPGRQHKELFLRRSASEPWKHYSTFTGLVVPDYKNLMTASHSKGWATYQKLRAMGWELVSQEEPARVEQQLVSSSK